MLANEERAAWVERGHQDPVRAYKVHANNAAQRGIAFELTFEEWWGMWEPHYERRGLAIGCMVMCRDGDVGPYAVGNVRIDTNLENARERGAIQAANRVEPVLTNAQRQKAFKESMKAAGYVKLEAYVTKEQRQKFRELGGDEWLQKKIDAAKVPSPLPLK